MQDIDKISVFLLQQKNATEKKRWQLLLYSEIHQNGRIYHSKYDTFVSIEIPLNSFKIVISMRWKVILDAVNVFISSMTLYSHMLV